MDVKRGQISMQMIVFVIQPFYRTNWTKNPGEKEHQPFYRTNWTKNPGEKTNFLKSERGELKKW